MKHKCRFHVSQMSPARFDHNKIISMVMEENRVHEAISYISSMTSQDAPGKAYQVFKNIRNKIIRNRNYHNAEGLTTLKIMASNAYGPDKSLMDFLLTLPLHNIHWAQTKKSFFSDPNLQEQFKNLKLIKDPFYEFDAPEYIKVQAQGYINKTSEENHMHKRRPAQEYHFTETEVEEMVNQATAFVESNMNWKLRRNSLMLLDCLSLLTGRRKWELCETLKLKSVPDHDYQANICGIGKTTIHTLDSNIWHVVPLLAPIEIITRGISNLRRYGHVPGKYNYHNPIFPRMRHTCYRNLFSYWAFKNRDTNKFLENESCSELGWKAKAVCISVNTLGAHYSCLRVQQNESNGESEPGGDYNGLN